MSPIDNHLRESLSRHAADVDGDGDRFAAVEQRARAMHRRRIAWLSGATAVVLAGGVLGGIALTGPSDDAVIVPGDTADATTAPPSPTSPPSPVPTASPPLADSAYLDWPYRSGDGVAALDPAGSVHPLWGGKLPNGTVVVVGQQVDAAGNVRAHAWITEQGKPSYEIDGAAVKPDVTKEVSFVLPGGEYPYVLVIGAPEAAQISYAADGTHFDGSIDTIDGWSLFRRTGSEGDRIQVLDGNGDLDHPMYEGPIDTGPTEPDV